MVTFPSNVPVVIIGAGPTGLTCANLLLTYGIDCIVLDRESGPLDLPRAIVLDDEGTRTLQTFGLDRTYLPATIPGLGTRYYDDRGTCFAQTGAGQTNYGFPKRQYILQPELETALRRALCDRAPRALCYSSEVTGITADKDGAVVQIRHGGDTFQMSTQWVLACDGGRSPTRERLNIAMVGNTYQQDWIVLDTTDDPDDTRYSKFFCSKLRPSVSVPAPNGGRRYEFMVLKGESPEDLLHPDSLTKLLRPHRHYDEANILRKTVYTFHARIAEKFREGRILLLGDAAHLTPPFAAQGMNAGLRDAHNVAWKIATVVAGETHERILDSYETERKKPAWDMIQLAVTMGNFVMPMTRDDLRFREHLLHQLEPFPAVRDYLSNMRFKPKPRHEDGLYLDLGNQLYEASMVGEMIPQPAIVGYREERLLDCDLGSGFALLAQDRRGCNALDELTRQNFLGLPLGKVVLPVQQSGKEARIVEAKDTTARPLRTHRDQIMLIRPDRYCAAVFSPETLKDGLARYCKLY